ncbi:MAG: tRNA-binding protein [Aestuariibacter sp.]
MSKMAQPQAVQAHKEDVISWSHFQQVRLCVGTIIAVDDFPEAKKPAYKLQVDFGSEIGTRKCSAQITALYNKQELLDKQVVAVVNFPPKQIGPFMSECLVTGFYRENGDVVLAVPDKPVSNGQRLG